jgi:hypothetical protein
MTMSDYDSTNRRRERGQSDIFIDLRKETQMSDNQITTEQVKQWRQALENEDAIRKEAGLKIDPANCEVAVVWGRYLDPYRVLSAFSGDQLKAIIASGDKLGVIVAHERLDTNWFARAADSDVWVLKRHLPEATRAALKPRWQAIIDAVADTAKPKNEAARPAGGGPAPFGDEIPFAAEFR